MFVKIVCWGCWWSDFLLNYFFVLLPQSMANNSENLEKVEELLAAWSKQIEQVLTESEQIRREADDIGPSAELNYWKSRMAKFNT